MPSRIKDEVIKEIETYELPNTPGWSVDDYIKAEAEEVDPEIRGFVHELLRLGYPTYTSCAGGSGHASPGGFVTIEQSLFPDEVDEIHRVAKKNNLKGVRIEPGSTAQQESRVSFKPVGGTKWKYRKYFSQEEALKGRRLTQKRYLATEKGKEASRRGWRKQAKTEKRKQYMRERMRGYMRRRSKLEGSRK